MVTPATNISEYQRKIALAINCIPNLSIIFYYKNIVKPNVTV